MSSRSLFGVIVLLASLDGLRADDLTRFDSEKAAHVAALVTKATTGESPVPVKVKPDLKQASGFSVKNKGAVIIPEEGLSLDSLKNVGAEPKPVGMLYSRGVTPIVADRLIAKSQHRLITVTEKNETAEIAVLTLAVAKVADRLVLVIYAGGKQPIAVTTLAEVDEKKDTPLDLDARGAGDGKAMVLINVLGKYRATIEITEME